MFIAIDSREQRAEATAFAGPAAEHDFLTGAALDLGPIALARTIDTVELLRDDSFERHLTGGFEHRFARRVEMFDVTDQRIIVELFDDPFQSGLALAQRSFLKVLAF